MNLLKSINLGLATKLKEKEYREAFFEEWSKDEVAEQLRRLRKLRKLRQIDVAEETGMKQSAISRIEKSDYSRWNFVTLLRLAQALDARVRVTLEPSEDVIQKYQSEEQKSVGGTSIASVQRADIQQRQPNIVYDGSRNLEHFGGRWVDANRRTDTSQKHTDAHLLPLASGQVGPNR